MVMGRGMQGWRKRSTVQRKGGLKSIEGGVVALHRGRERAHYYEFLLSLASMRNLDRESIEDRPAASNHSISYRA